MTSASVSKKRRAQITRLINREDSPPKQRSPSKRRQKAWNQHDSMEPHRFWSPSPRSKRRSTKWLVISLGRNEG